MGGREEGSSDSHVGGGDGGGVDEVLAMYVRKLSLNLDEVSGHVMIMSSFVIWLVVGCRFDYS